MASMTESLECSVCLLTYNLTDRLPKALSCLHSICGQCVDQLKKGTSFNCPTCRKPCQVGQVAVNFGLTDVLRTLCEECLSKSQKKQCPHCNKNLCAKCLETHAKDVHKELLLGLTKLDQAIRQANDVSNDHSVVEQEQKKERDTIEEIKQAIQYHRDALDKLEKKLEGEVISSKQRNVDAFMNLNMSLNEKITTSRNFSMQTKNVAGLTFNKRTPIENMIKLQKQSESLLNELNQQMNNKPALDDYQFVKSTLKFDPLLVGKLKRDAISSMPQVGTRVHNVPDYTTLRYESLTGSKGSEPHQFDKPWGVVCTPDQVIVTDQLNHRVKFYDTNLDLQFVVGEEGSGKNQFCNPTGVARGPGGEVYVCDLGNDRIVILSPRGEYLRSFGSEGSGRDQFQRPQGIAISDGYVFIIDKDNYRVKVVKTDGSFVRHIGSKGSSAGQFENIPLCVAMMSPGDGRVLVNELKKKQLHGYTKTGEFQGLFPPHIPTQLATALIRDMTVDTADNVIVTYNTHQLAVYNRRGDLITVVGSEGSKPGQFWKPQGVSVDTQSGRVVVSDYLNNRIQMFKFDMK